MTLLITDLDTSKLNLSPDCKVVRATEDRAHCVGCFGCWVKTPGQCVIPDAYQTMARRIHAAEEVVVRTKWTYGGFSPFVKNVFDRSIGVVLQENYFFSGTVRENISLTKRNASIEEIIYAAKLAGADEFVQKLPRGYDTMLEENASNLSGGQKQRLALARALAMNSPILVLDDTTSAVDMETERYIQKQLAAHEKSFQHRNLQTRFLRL